MLCRNCGSLLDDGAKFCDNCGAPQTPAQSNDQNASWEQQQEERRRQNWQQYQQEHPNYQQNRQNYQQGYQPIYQQPINQQIDMPMKWFKFIIYFQLFMAMIVSFSSAISSFTGSQYEETKELIYATYAGIKTVDIIYGVLCIMLVVFAFVVRQQLAQFKKKGPALYLAYLAANTFVSVLYVVLLLVMTDMSLADLDIWTIGVSLIMSIIMICINTDYFNKRKHLFTN